ncbi:hypothetical protein GQ602_007277 [Ophiocordyceps camponoti-floridani]|uniref:Uncharacterized protein n=1 Tax=Ophiocordyceps camponoti-floridani TaxID=2030778 RepID=A0A8H4Q111_9HYPO|nr:hypothetical protein GQ602_007277 [Ophiocordyceps camponoti-floridani]
MQHTYIHLHPYAHTTKTGRKAAAALTSDERLRGSRRNPPPSLHKLHEHARAGISLFAADTSYPTADYIRLIPAVQ